MATVRLSANRKTTNPIHVPDTMNIKVIVMVNPGQ